MKIWILKYVWDVIRKQKDRSPVNSGRPQEEEDKYCKASFIWLGLHLKKSGPMLQNLSCPLEKTGSQCLLEDLIVSTIWQSIECSLCRGAHLIRAFSKYLSVFVNKWLQEGFYAQKTSFSHPPCSSASSRMGGTGQQWKHGWARSRALLGPSALAQPTGANECKLRKVNAELSPGLSSKANSKFICTVYLIRRSMPFVLRRLSSPSPLFSSSPGVFGHIRTCMFLVQLDVWVF